MDSKFVINEKIIGNDKCTIKFKKEIPNFNHIEIINSAGTTTHSFFVSRDFGNYYYRLLRNSLAEGCDLTTLVNLFFLDYIIYEDDYDFYSDIFKDIYGRRPRYSKDEWKRLVANVRSLKPEALTPMSRAVERY